MITQIPTSLLKMTREEAGLNQAQLATVLQIDKSIVSRLEKTEIADLKMAERYLSAVNTDLAQQVLQYYNQHWKFIERPQFIHPEREILWAAEQSLLLLDNFENTPQFDSILQEPLSKLRKRIIIETDFIRHMEHSIAFIGKIGVGKTTALSFITNLTMIVKSGKDAGKIKSVFPTGSGRTTVCEVAIKIAPAFGIAVDNLSEGEIRQIVSVLVDSLKTKKGGLPTELERVIRNMADLLPRSPKSPKDSIEKIKPIDPIKEMMDTEEDVDQVVAEIISRMKLDTRTDAQMILSESAEDNLDWLATNIAKINFGQHPGFSVPKRITVLLPLKALRDTPYLLSVIDTKGVDGTTQRPDLRNQIDDHRTITVLCAKFSDAPGDIPVSIMRDVIESGSDALEAGRLCLLVLPQNDEALKVVDDMGDTPDTDEEGYAIRETHIEQQFATEELPSIPIKFYNAEKDKPEDAWMALTSMIGDLRSRKVSRINRLIDAADNLVTNSDVAKNHQARCDIASTMEQTANRFQKLPTRIRPTHNNLITQIKKIHPSSIAASANRKRRGKWDNCPVNYFLEVGVQNDANLRTRESFIRIDEQLEGLKTKYIQLLDVKQFIESLQDDINESKQKFLTRAALAGQTSFAPHLEEATQLWIDCENKYGGGDGYRNFICDIFLEHFEQDSKAIEVNSRIEAALMKIWNDLVINPLKEAVSFKLNSAEE